MDARLRFVSTRGLARPAAAHLPHPPASDLSIQVGQRWLPMNVGSLGTSSEEQGGLNLRSVGAENKYVRLRQTLYQCHTACQLVQHRAGHIYTMSRAHMLADLFEGQRCNFTDESRVGVKDWVRGVDAAHGGGIHDP